MKIAKEMKLAKHKNYNISFGTVSNKKPKSIFLNFTAWVEPINKDENIDYSRVIKKLHKTLKQNTFNFLNENNTIFSNNTIIDLDIRESGVRFGKRSFMCCEMTFFLLKETEFDSNKVINEIDKLTPIFINKILEKDKNFIFHKKKI